MPTTWRLPIFAAAIAAFAMSATAFAAGDEVIAPINERFKSGEIEETPSFQKHVVPVMGRLGCNGRACHGSFQGRGGFRLSLFGYDFKADHEALWDKESPRVNTDDVSESLIIAKPTDELNHEGGERYKIGSWEHHVFQKWIAAGADFKKEDIVKLESLQIEPPEILFKKEKEVQQLRVIAHWADGSKEDVTPLCRFQSNDDLVAKIDENGKVVSGEPGDTHVVVFYDKGVVPVPVIRPVTDLTGDKYPEVAASKPIDKAVVTKLRKLGVVPSEIAGDAAFLRRISLDLTGTLPPAKDVEAFVANKSPNKRSEKIEELLDSPAYAAWWTTKLCDFTGNNDDQLNNVLPVRTRASQDWYDWIYHRVENNTPYDELVGGILMGKSRQGDQSYSEYCAEMSQIYGKGDMEFAHRDSMPFYWARRDFREIDARAVAFAYTFLGIRIQCAQCHKHPFDQWSKEDFHTFKPFFANVVATNRNRPDDKAEYMAMMKKLDLDGLRGNEARKKMATLLEEGKTVPFGEIYADKARVRRVREPDSQDAGTVGRLLGGEEFDLTQFKDARQPVMDWLRDADNPFFAKAFVNRVWANYFNVGIVSPADDMSLGNPPSNKPLLDYLANGFIEHNFDMKWLHREICNSDTYQRDWRPNETNRADERNFSRAVVRRLPAEVVYDALRTATASTADANEVYTSLEDRAIAIPGAGRRYGNRNGGYALQVFGRSTRESNCDCDRSSEVSLLQTVFLRNDFEMSQMIDRKGGWLFDTVGPVSGGKNKPPRPKNFDNMLANYQKKVAQAKKAGQLDQVKRMKQRIKQFTDRYATPIDEADVKDGDLNVEAIVRDAYLRTLSRSPDKRELERSVAYINDSESKGTAVRGLLWALINTKEFVVNH